MNPTHPPDASARQRALQTDQSFIVQAPAGSGKTTLLVSRYLALLSRVQTPEEILAVTFTRKAANEMRERVLEAFELARREVPPTDAGDAALWRLGQDVLRQNRALDWALDENPSRLRIQTIDSLCHALARQMPMLSRFGRVPATREDASDLYRDAARRALQHVAEDDEWGEAVAVLMLHLDNDHQRVVDLLALMLAKRDQWQRHVHRAGGKDRRELEAALASVISAALAAARDAIPADIGAELLAVVREAAGNIDGDSPLARWRDVTAWPDTGGEDVPAWVALRDFVLTDEGEWRKRYDKRQGVLAPSSTRDKELKQRYARLKDRLLALSEHLQAKHDGLRQRLNDLPVLPNAVYTDSQWTVLKALFDVLFTAVGHLQLEFIAEGSVDFAEVAQRALDALGDEQAPTDLALALDYRIQHILVDEFQDTSFGQFVLLEKLTAGWTPGDGRTLFLVGDPMQSIYRFREADVGLFLWARRNGLGGVPLESLTLTANFRSDAGVVTWVNETFENVFPAQEDMARGAVPYSWASAMRAARSTPAVCIHPSFGRDDLQEARHVVKLVDAALREDAAQSVAVLVQARPHVAQIAQMLKSAGIAFSAVDIESLGRRPLVQDLLALLRALTHLGDRLAWLSVLRAPWAGLALADLRVIAQEAGDGTVWDALCNPAAPHALSADGRARWQRLHAVLENALTCVPRWPLCDVLRSTWLALGGPAIVSQANDLADAEAFFDLVERTEQEERAGVAERVAAGLDRLYAAPVGDASARVHIMTIHKSKGLEFDTVILPGLARTGARDAQRLLYWLELPSPQLTGRLLFAPIKAAGEKAESISDFLRDVDRQKARYEQARLLYVAATRAKRRLHLIGHAERAEKNGEVKINPPREGTLLRLLWHVAEPEFARLLSASGPVDAAGDAESAASTSVTHPPRLTRVAAGWTVPSPPPALPVAVRESLSWTVRPPIEVEYDWAQRPARLAGTVVHRFIKRIADEGLETWSPARVAESAAALNLALSRLGLEDDELDRATQRALAALKKTVSEPRGRWVLSAQHREPRNEWALTGIGEVGLKRIIIDRTFIDGDVRWIIDYKTGVHLGEDVDGFLDQEVERYRGQLTEYAAFVQRLDPRPIRLGLYYPLLDGWREWSFEG